MFKSITLGLLTALPSFAWADDMAISAVDAWRVTPSAIQQGADVDLKEFKWVARPVLVFADSPFDLRFIEQMELLGAQLDELVERDVVIVVDTDPDNASDLRQEMHPRDFSFVLIGKDGAVKLRKPFPWDVRELSRVIDKMPIRQLEISKQREARDNAR